MNKEIEALENLIIFQEMDRVEFIRQADKQYNLKGNAYLSFSGGKDSTVAHYLLDISLPGNRIPRVFIDTGIEYDLIRKFVQELAERDDRIIILKPSLPIKATLERYGYPFKSKEHSMRVNDFNRGSQAPYIQKYIRKTEKRIFVCPKILRYQFEERGKYPYSDKCCDKMKKEPIRKWERENGKTICITGMRKQEGGNRNKIGCITHKKGTMHINPLAPMKEEWLDGFIKEHEIRLSDLYYPPFNFKRTGCKGCPFSLDLEEQLDKMAIYLPKERAQCEAIWKPVYDEYRRIGYRLKKEKQR